ncbi:Hypothetical predicted protein [Olea europaea subsp. europaea]|uniref:Uncharacterized protein n=1 Tax=Olea europaea subsp. europaea TaxID=158383 RepID=A0A8S0U3I8_OLEEU|nr:Hypothetical predicted protein [Olea europaea subsp. europaea]
MFDVFKDFDRYNLPVEPTLKDIGQVVVKSSATATKLGTGLLTRNRGGASLALDLKIRSRADEAPPRLPGRFEVISLTGSFLRSDNNGNLSRTGGLRMSLAW